MRCRYAEPIQPYAGIIRVMSDHRYAMTSLMPLTFEERRQRYMMVADADIYAVYITRQRLR